MRLEIRCEQASGGSGGQVLVAMGLESDGERILACYSVLNPDKLRRV